MLRLRSHKWLAFLCIALVVCAAVTSASTDLGCAILTPLWLIIPATVVTLIQARATVSDEQPASLVALIFFRAPPPAV